MRPLTDPSPSGDGDSRAGAAVLERARALLEFRRADQARALVASLHADDVGPQVAREARVVLAQSMEAAGDIDGASTVWEDLYVENLAEGRPREAAVAAMNVVAAQLELGSAVAATEFGRDAVVAVEAAGAAGTDEHVRLAVTVVWVLVERGQLVLAAHTISELVRFADQCGSRWARGSAYWNASVVAWRAGQLDLAVAHAEHALELMDGSASHRDVPRLRLHLAEVHVSRGEVGAPKALELLLDVVDELGTFSILEGSRCWRECARAHLLMGEIGRAHTTIRLAVDLLGDQVVPDLCLAYLVWGDICAASGDAEGALDKYRWAAQRLAMMDMGWQAIASLRALGDRLLEGGDPAMAVKMYAAAVDHERSRSVSERAVRRPLPAIAHEAALV